LLEALKHNQPHLGYSHPEWLVSRWEQYWGQEATVRLMDWNNTPPQTFARVNTLKTDPDKLLAQWRDEGVAYDFVRHDWFPENLVFQLKSHPVLEQLPSFQQGLFYVQDASTLLAVQLLDPRPGQTVLDLCAAPGGKLSYIAQLLRNQGSIFAHDVSPGRLKLIQENCARLGVAGVQLLGDRGQHAAKRFDRILVDAPCSNTGVMRRRVDLRWRLRPEEIDRLRAVQLGLLKNAGALLRPGGRLIYSTCSLEPDENEQLIQEFLKGHPVLKLQTERQIGPLSERVDGAYVACLGFAA
jgi:16S rRNA (cytosine967-C5)-methyltransferase